MKQTAAAAVIIAAFLILQSTFLAAANPKPDGVLALTMAAAWMGGPVSGSLTGFFGGLCQDALGGMSAGNFCLAGTVAGWLLGWFFKRLYADHFLFQFLGSAAAGAAYFFAFRQLALWRGIFPAGSVPVFSFSWDLLEAFLCMLFIAVFQNWVFPKPIKL